MKQCKCFAFVEQFDIDVLRRLHTKQLLKPHYRIGGWSANSGEYSCCPECSEECQKCINNADNNKKIVKSILDTREHVPNKKESKQLRKERIKIGK